MRIGVSPRALMTNGLAICAAPTVMVASIRALRLILWEYSASNTLQNPLCDLWKPYSSVVSTAKKRPANRLNRRRSKPGNGAYRGRGLRKQAATVCRCCDRVITASPETLAHARPDL